MELKCEPQIEVRAAQVVWFEKRMAAGGHPLFLVRCDDVFIVVPGSAAASIRKDSSRGNIMRHATVVWEKKIDPTLLLEVLKNPEKCYGH